jgi:hypothetical protein
MERVLTIVEQISENLTARLSFVVRSLFDDDVADPHYEFS